MATASENALFKMIGGRMCRSIQGCMHVRSQPSKTSWVAFHQWSTLAANQTSSTGTSRVPVTMCQKILTHKRLICTTQKLCSENPLQWFDRALELYDQKQALQKADTKYVETETEKKQRKIKIFHAVVEKYVDKEKVYKRRHVEFVRNGLSKMKEMNVHHDLSCYKALLKCFPTEVMVPRTVWQVEFKHYPKQQDCCIEIMDQMEQYGVIADREFGELLLHITGDRTHAFRKYRRHVYWARKFANLSPFPLPREMPDEALQLALLALKRMSVDLENEITVWKTAQVEESPLEDTFIASAQAPTQRELLKKHSADVPLYVEGGYTTYLRHKSVTYFVLKAEADPDRFVSVEPKVEDDENLMNFSTPFEEEDTSSVVEKPSEHEQEDGTIFAMCVTGTSSKDSLITWIRYLQKKNPVLEHIKIVFTLKSPDLGPGISTPLIEHEKKLIEGSEEDKMK